MSNTLSIEKQILILRGLTEGNSIRSLERMTGVNRNTILSLLKRAGERAKSIMDSEMVNIKSNLVQVDEIWTYVGKKQKNLQLMKDIIPIVNLEINMFSFVWIQKLS